MKKKTGCASPTVSGETGLRRYLFLSLALHGLFLLLCGWIIVSDAPPSGSPNGQFFHGRFEEQTSQPLPPPATFDRAAEPEALDESFARNQGDGIANLPEDEGIVLGGVAMPPLVASRPRCDAGFLGMSVKGESIVFLLDGSGSMLEKIGQERRYDAAAHQIMESVKALSASQRFNIIVFGSRPIALASEPIGPVASNIDRAEKFLQSDPDCGGATILENAFTQALRMNPDAIVLLTDGEPNEQPDITLAQIHYLRQKLSSTSQIYTVGMQGKNEITDEIFLRKLSSQNNGTYIHWIPPTEVALSPVKPQGG